MNPAIREAGHSLAGGDETQTDRRALLRGAAGGVTSFAVAVLPDTQFCSRYASTDEGQQFQLRFGFTPYDAQTGWIAAHAQPYNIPFVILLGDVVDQQGKPKQWEVADAAMKELETAGELDGPTAQDLLPAQSTGALLLSAPRLQGLRQAQIASIANDTVPAVPEPGTWLVALAGLGLLAVADRRRAG